MQAAGRTAHDILLYQTPHQTIGMKSLMFISERNNHILLMNISSYLIANTVTIENLLGHRFVKQGRINLIDTTIPMTTAFNVYSLTLLPFSQHLLP